ncbi:hypothetical protein HNY73_014345 [Argiope bruennichi]|uniref:Uncharacterized protein n=1 Tax=Argiope bruennichi TaxID=94029 RepID=A0A8T0ETY8_ARGBR|nr:hypothetical protein HNY73_014345 [Argiope bruennichi]
MKTKCSILWLQSNRNRKLERLVLSFPATAANYPKVVAQLKERFRWEDLLVQIYVRDLLTIIIKNAVSSRAKTDLSRLYDELEGKLRTLESLGHTQEKFRNFLAPLVESCLPEEVLMMWERIRNHHELGNNTDEKNARSLESLMTFLRQEVQGEEMVALSRIVVLQRIKLPIKRNMPLPLKTKLMEIRRLQQP